MGRNQLHDRREKQFHYGHTCLRIFICVTLVCELSNIASAQIVGSLTDEDIQTNQTTATAHLRVAVLNRISKNKTSRLNGSTSSRRDSDNQRPHFDDRQLSQANYKTPINNKWHEEILSTDCLSKRNEILSRAGGPEQQLNQRIRAPTPAPRNPTYQRLKPIQGNAASIQHSTTQAYNETQPILNNIDGEHVPKCNENGGYEPVQCHKIGYCWCVNKYGQAIKKTAVMVGQEPSCEPTMYDSESNDWVVVAGVSGRRIDQLLRNVSNFESTTPNGNLNFEATEPTTDHHDSSASGDTNIVHSNGAGPESVIQHRGKDRRPVMPLVPNDCQGSRENARERANKFMNNTIWIPNCDPENERLYAERQCYQAKTCWCVDQSTGLPLLTSDQVTSRSTSNCTELRKLIGLSSRPKPQPAFYHGSSDHCTADHRADFIVSLNNQFRQQISEYIRQNASSLNSLPQGIKSTNPYAINEAQVSRWKFSIMDRDMDGNLGDREWSKFKNNFKLVDRTEELDNPLKQQRTPYFSLTPLLILRSQRKCWRDFLEFCGSGDLLINESISLNKWLSCTEVPRKLDYGESDRHSSRDRIGMENTYAHSREAAINRSKEKNPFLQILKPD